MPKYSESELFLAILQNGFKSHSELENFLVGDQVLSEDKKKVIQNAFRHFQQVKERKFKKIQAR